MTNELAVSAMSDYLVSQGIQKGSDEYKDLMTAGSTLLGTAVGALAGNANTGANVATNATVNNYLKHTELDQKKAELAACKDKTCTDEVNAKWNQVSQDRNEQMRDSCTNPDQCRANLTEMQTDLAGLLNSGTSTGGNQYTPEESKNIKQLESQYINNLTVLRDLGDNYLSSQESAFLQQYYNGGILNVFKNVALLILTEGALSKGTSAAKIGATEAETINAIKPPVAAESAANTAKGEAIVTSEGTANSATAPGLKQQLANENLANISAQDARFKVGRCRERQWHPKSELLNWNGNSY